jgi:2-oxoisovalerate dehydrogenase E1 component alpha subunit
MGAHTTTDDPTRYRLASELEAWKLKDPIERVKAYLARTYGVDSGFFAEIDREADELGARIRHEVRSMPDPGPLEMFANVYAEQHSLVDEERSQFAAYLDSFADTEEGTR